LKTGPKGLALSEQLPFLLLPYQQRWVADTSPFKVWEKSRRIGASWPIACEAVLLAAARKGMDCYYLSYNYDMTKQFISDAAMWARAFDLVVGDITEDEVLEKNGDETKAIKIYEIRFASGHVVQALSSKPKNFRSKQGYAIVDEAAYVDDLKAIRKAAAAFILWGGRVAFVSSHNGVDSEFNKMVQACRAGELSYSLHRTTFDDAIAEGLYERICLVLGLEWSQEAEDEWRIKAYADYGEDADEELRCIPAKSGGQYFDSALIVSAQHDSGTVITLKCEDQFAYIPEEERKKAIADWLHSDVDQWLEKLPADRRHVLGQDFGRSSDLSSIAIGTVLQNALKVMVVLEMSKVPYEAQKQILLHIMAKVPRFSYLCIDSTGNGAYLGEVAAQRDKQRVEQVKFSEKIWAEELPRMKAAMQGKRLLVPRSNDIKDDFRSFVVKEGTPRLPASKGSGKRHGDSAVSIMLCNRASQADYPVVEYEAVTSSVWAKKRR
jgi:phage FluMu gp28-like protein